MADDRHGTDSDANFADGDYGYDEAHEATPDASAAAHPAGQEQWQSVHVEAPADDDGGDYGYDLAHDMGPR
jgi:hypothetical protein